MKRSFIILMAASALAALSCTKEVNDQTAPEKEQVTMSFDATMGVPTKVELGAANGEGGYKVLWSKDDNIKVFANGASTYDGVEFSTDIEEASATATFTGTIDADDTYYAFYPSTTNAKWYGSSNRFGVTLSANQEANGIASGFAYAKAEGTSLQFKHLTGFVKFTIPAEYDGKIVKVTFSGNGDSPAPLAGFQYIYPDNPSTNDFSDYKFTEISLSTASGDAFATGTYYIVSFPATLSEGITMTFTNTEGATATKTSSKPAAITTGDILNVGTITGLTYEAAYKHSLPWSENFSEAELANYITAGDEVSVKAEENYATGEKPELYLKGSSSFSAKIDVKNASRNLTLTYKTNKASLVLSASEGVTPNKQITGDAKTYLYHVTLADNVEQMTLTWASSENSRLDDILLVEGTISFQTLTFDKTSAAATIGEDFTEPVLSGAKTTVSYSSSDPSVATVNATTGEVSLVSDGETVITATAVGTSQYYEAAASYTLTVSPAPTGNEKYYVKVTSAPDDWSGTYLIVFGNKAHATIDGSDLKATVSSLSIANNAIVSSDDLKNAVVTIEKSGNSYTIKFANGKYFAAGAKKCISQSTAFKWNINYTSSGVKLSGTVNNVTYILYSNGGNYFRCYEDKSSNSTYKLPDLYKLEN